MKTKIAASTNRLFKVTLFLATFAALWPLHMRANTIAASFSSYSTIGFGSDETRGWAFSLSTNIMLTDLGVFDGNTNLGTGDGLADSHIVTIWTDTGVQVAQATVPSGTGATLVNGFRYVSLLSSVPLAAGNYVIGAYYPTGGSDIFATTVNGLTTASEVTFGGVRAGSGNAFPNNAGTRAGDFGPNFQFTTATNGVSDLSSTLMLLAISLAPLLVQGATAKRGSEERSQI